MRTRVISQDDPRAVELALTILKSGGLVAFPTDTVYGLAASAFNPQAIDRLFAVKERAPSKAIAVLIGDQTQLAMVSGQVNLATRHLAQKFWPGALTLVLPRHPSLPGNLSPSATIGVRMPDHAFACTLIVRSGPLATTSANLSGGPNPLNAQEVLAQLNGSVELVVDGGQVTGGVPSTVLDLTQQPPVILRRGEIGEDQIQAALEKIQNGQ